jgi:hypothetical protein
MAPSWLPPWGDYYPYSHLMQRGESDVHERMLVPLMMMTALMVRLSWISLSLP